MRRRPPRSTRTVTLFPYTTLFRSFPPSDPQWRGVASSRFLEYAAERVAKRDGFIEHVDLTLICEAPKIGPHRDAMRGRIAEILGLSLDRVSVKATTTERRSEERRVGKGSVSPCRSRWCPYT